MKLNKKEVGNSRLMLLMKCGMGPAELISRNNATWFNFMVRSFVTI